jgi:hypothetical protein
MVSRSRRLSTLLANYSNGNALDSYKTFISSGMTGAYKYKHESTVVEYLNSMVEWKYIFFACHIVDEQFYESTNN